MLLRLRTSLLLPAIATVTIGAVVGCSSKATTTDDSGASGGAYPATVKSCGKDITVESAPERIVALDQSSTEMLLSLGVADRMAGTAGWTDPILPSLADENAKVKRLADQRPSYETLLATEPDLVAAGLQNTLSEGGVATPQQLAKVGVPAYLSAVECAKSDFSGSGGDGAREKPMDMAMLHTEIRDLATLVDTPDEGEKLISSLDARLAKASQKKFPGVSVAYWFANAESPYLAGCCGSPGIATRALGLTNIIGDQKAEWPQIGWETIAAADPDVIVLGDLTRKSQTAETAAAKIKHLESHPVTREMTAVKNKRYIAVAGADLNPSIRTVDAVEKISGGLTRLGFGK